MPASALGAEVGVMDKRFPIQIGSLIVAVGLTVPARPAAADPAPTLPIVLQVPGRSSVPLHLVIRAKAEVERIYRDAGVNVSWIGVSSGTSQPEPEHSPEAAGPPFGLVVLPPEFADKLTVSPDALGAAAGTRANRGRIAYVFYDRVERIAETYLNASRQRVGNVDTVAVLAHAMAHEIGHLLLPHGHSDSGLMRADWDADDLRNASQGELNFTAEEAKSIRARLLAPLDSE